MIQHFLPDYLGEPERYELQESSWSSLELSRRAFFRLVGGGLVVALWTADALAQQRPDGGRRPPRGGDTIPKEIGAWLHIGEDSAVTVYTGKVEIGQNIRTSLTQVVAEELRVKPKPNPHGHGRHAAGAIRFRDCRQPDHTRDGRSTATRRSRCQGTVARPGRRARKGRARNPEHREGKSHRSRWQAFL